MLEISREKPKKPRKPRGRFAGLGIGICVAALVLCALVGASWPWFLSVGFYGLFGVYTYAILFLTFFAGVSLYMSKKYSFNKRYMTCSIIMLCTVFTAIHLGVTAPRLSGAAFDAYLRYGFSYVTPGGAIFSIPSFVLWNMFAGGVGAGIALAAIFVVSAAFLLTFIVTRHGENKVIRKKAVPDVIDPNVVADAPGAIVNDNKDLADRLEQKYQELLQKQSRKNIDLQKSSLGLDRVAPRPVRNAPVYDSAVPLNELSPSPTALADNITKMSTEAALKFNAAIAPEPFPTQSYASEYGQKPNVITEFPGAFASPSYGQSTYKSEPQSPYASQSLDPTPAVFSESTKAMSPQSAASIFTEYELENSRETIDVAPTVRARNPKPVGGAAGGLGGVVGASQTALDGVMQSTKPKNYKPKRYTKPSIEMIRSESTDLSGYQNEARIKQDMLDAKLKEFSVNAKVTGFTVAPAITRFEITLGLGTRAADVYRLDDDFQVILGTTSIRMENVMGKNAIGIEVPNKTIGSVSIKDILQSKEWTQTKSPLCVALGKNINDEVVVGDIGSMPHLLIAGSTGSGKSVCINTILTSLIYRADPADVKLLLVDMKLVELAMYNEIPHMLIPNSIGEVQHAINALLWMQEEMRRRYKILQSQGLKHVSQYQALPAYVSGQLERMQYILMVIDEAADLIYTGKRAVEDAVKQLSALGRASGIHLILATQRPSVDVITAVIKANLPVRIGFKTVSRGDSMTIVNEIGCEKLVGRGDMLFSREGKIQRIQGAFIDDEEARRIMNFIRENNVCEFNGEVEDFILNGPPQAGGAAVGFGDGPAAARNQDPAFIPILRWLVRPENEKKIASIAGVQRQFSLGFGRAGRIMDQLTQMGYVSDDNGQKGRLVLITKEEVDQIYGAE